MRMLPVHLAGCGLLVCPPLCVLPQQMLLFAPSGGHVELHQWGLVAHAYYAET